jgi:hypothetical protein
LTGDSPRSITIELPEEKVNAVNAVKAKKAVKPATLKKAVPVGPIKRAYWLGGHKFIPATGGAGLFRRYLPARVWKRIGDECSSLLDAGTNPVGWELSAKEFRRHGENWLLTWSVRRCRDTINIQIVWRKTDNYDNELRTIAADIALSEWDDTINNMLVLMGEPTMAKRKTTK